MLRFKADDGSDFPKWEEKKLDQIGRFIGGGTPSTKIKEYWKGNLPWISSADLCEDDINTILITRFITDEAVEQSATKRIPRNAILIICRVGVGKVALSPCELCTSQDFVSLVDYDEDKHFLTYAILRLMQSKSCNVQGTSIKGIPVDEIKAFKISIPSLPEQRKIATFLSTIDEIIATTEAEVSAWEERKKGVMQKLFSQEVRFKADDGSDFPAWEEKKLDEVVEFLDGLRKPLETGERIAGPYPYYGASGIIDYVENYIFDEELILLSEDGANILDRNYRVAFLAKGKYWVNNHAHVLKAIDGNVNNFICEQLESFDYRKYNSGGAQPKLNQATCRGILMQMPVVEEQQKIADCLSSLDDVINQTKAELAAWQEFKKGLLQQMFV